jgi:hypothetical protein
MDENDIFTTVFLFILLAIKFHFEKISFSTDKMVAKPIMITISIFNGKSESQYSEKLNIRRKKVQLRLLTNQ